MLQFETITTSVAKRTEHALGRVYREDWNYEVFGPGVPNKIDVIIRSQDIIPPPISRSGELLLIAPSDGQVSITPP